MKSYCPELTVEETLWFGAVDRPLFGWLTRPSDALARGGVLLAPPIGREAFPTRRILRRLATSLAERGFVVLRFDYHGTGDSSGLFDEANRDRAWVDSVSEGTEFLRSLGLSSISAVGMRLGATLVGTAAARPGVQFSSVVLWDPCESGRSYLRELTALERLRQDDFEIIPDGPVETSEYLFTQQAAAELRRLSLSDLEPGTLADRVLVMQRDDRATPKRLRQRLEQENVEWMSTSEQGAMLDVESFFAARPDQTLARITNWLSEAPGPLVPIETNYLAKAIVVSRDADEHGVSERSIELGPRKLFGVVSEPTTDARGPWIVFLNSVNDDHVGRARLWVELSRRWASYGLRCARVDLSGYGESPWPAGQVDRISYDLRWTEDAADTARALSPDDPSNVVFIGLCSGAYVAISGAASVKARGVCAINPPAMIDYVHGVERLERSRRKLVRALAVRIKPLAITHQWVAATLARACQMVLRGAYSGDVLSKLVADGTSVLVFGAVDDLTPYPRTPLLRSIDIRRLGMSKKYSVEFVSGMDHSLHRAQGRRGVVTTLERHVLEHFAQVSPYPEPETPPSDEL